MGIMIGVPSALPAQHRLFEGSELILSSAIRIVAKTMTGNELSNVNPPWLPLSVRGRNGTLACHQTKRHGTLFSIGKCCSRVQGTMDIASQALESAFARVTLSSPHGLWSHYMIGLVVVSVFQSACFYAMVTACDVLLAMLQRGRDSPHASRDREAQTGASGRTFNAHVKPLHFPLYRGPHVIIILVFTYKIVACVLWP
jgi:hypothetical protein